MSFVDALLAPPSADGRLTAPRMGAAPKQRALPLDDHTVRVTVRVNECVIVRVIVRSGPKIPPWWTGSSARYRRGDP